MTSPRVDLAVVGHWIDGEPAPVDAPERSGPVFDPTTGVVQRRVAFADGALVNRAVRSARAAFGEWSQLSLARRTAIVLRFRELFAFEEALGIVNGNPYGNGAAILSSDGGIARQFRARAAVAMVAINVPIPVATAPFSFGGWKDSLFGDLHGYGREGVLFNTRGKVVTERRPRGRSNLRYGFPGSH
jgi:acyl-CoA reductase-like NAD-dependent aldehyde dehydrogenase